VQLGEWTVGRVVQEPGWRYSTDMAPITGPEWCPSRHVGVTLSGRQGPRLQDGTIREFGPGDVYDIPPGHDGDAVGDEPAVLLEWVGLQVWGGRASRFPDRVLLTLMLTDIVDSTVMAAELGDTAWKDRLGHHYESVRAELERFRGREIDTTGDGLLAAFDGPARALACASAMRDAAARDGLHVRAGIHTGEVERVGTNVRGMTVHEVARIVALAGADEILAPATTAALAGGAGLTFEDRGEHLLKGVDGPRRLMAFVG
jgi:class 3 adenylate cyclase